MGLGGRGAGGERQRQNIYIERDKQTESGRRRQETHIEPDRQIQERDSSLTYKLIAPQKKTTRPGEARGVGWDGVSAVCVLVRSISLTSCATFVLKTGTESPEGRRGRGEAYRPVPGERKKRPLKKTGELFAIIQGQTCRWRHTHSERIAVLFFF